MLGIVLSKSSGLSLKRQIYQEIKERILTGALKASEALPSTRALCSELSVSRNTVCEAYDMLIAEGFVINRQGAQTKVAEGLILIPTETAPQIIAPKSRTYTADFRTGRPDLREFPKFLWQQLLHKAALDIPTESYGYTSPQGIPELRFEIASWLYRSRGISVNINDIFITSGATHALHLIAELICPDNKGIIMEDPCHTGMLRTFINKGCPIIPIPVDEFGMKTECLRSFDNIGALYVTPSHQFPLGGIMSATRRTALIRYASLSDIYIIEDDYDSEFRYTGEPITPLYSMDPTRVIYVGTFSKTVFPALRIGFAILPQPLHNKWRDLRKHADVQNPIFDQLALTEFMSTRKFDRHIRKMRKLYGERRLVLLDGMTKMFGDQWRTFGDAAGLHLAIEFDGLCFDDEFKKSCLSAGINVMPMDAHSIEKGRHISKLLIGYGHLQAEEIRIGIKHLHDFVVKYSTK